METDWEDDWENTDIPDLLVSIQNKERELKLLVERKLMEDADLDLTEELFRGEQSQKKVESFAPIKLDKKEKPKSLQMLQEQKRKELQEKQKQESQKQKERKQLQKKHKELVGEAEFDEYDERYGHLEDQY